MIVIKLFNNINHINHINHNIELEFIGLSKIDNYPLFKMFNYSINNVIMQELFLNYSKLNEYLRILKLKKINKNITKYQLIDFVNLQFIKDNYNNITCIACSYK